MVEYLILLQNIAFEQRTFWRLHDNSHDKEKRIDNKCGQFREILWYFVGIFHLKHIFVFLSDIFCKLIEATWSQLKETKNEIDHHQKVLVSLDGSKRWESLRDLSFELIIWNICAQIFYYHFSVYIYINSYMHIPFK